MSNAAPPRLGGAAILVILLGLVTGSATAEPVAGAVNVSNPVSQFAGCTADDVAGQQTGGEGVNYPNTEVEPYVDVDPSQPERLAATWQQDRWSTGSARGLVIARSGSSGATWSTSPVPGTSDCASAPTKSYTRASDPWLSFGPTGVLFHGSMAGNAPGQAAVLVNRSDDGGATWSNPAVVDPARPEYSNDKPSVTADPRDPNRVYATWTKVTTPDVVERLGDLGLLDVAAESGGSALMFSSSVDGGRTWMEPAYAYDPGAVRLPLRVQIPLLGVVVDLSNALQLDNPLATGGALGGQVLVLPDGTLVDMFAERLANGSIAVSAVRSADGGRHWSYPIRAAPITARVGLGGPGVADPDDPNVPIRTGLPDFTVDRNPRSPAYGRIHAVWEDAREGNVNRIAYTSSRDGGLTWAGPTMVNRASGAADAFVPSVAVLDDGTVGVSYYDLRHNDAGPGTPADYWLASCRPTERCNDPSNWNETRVTDISFDMRKAPYSTGLFLGDYAGLAGMSQEFAVVFSRTTDEPANPTQVVFDRVVPR